MSKIKEGIGKVAGAAKKAGAKLKGQSGLIATLQKEHTEVTTLMKQAKMGGASNREDLLPKIRMNLLAHTHAEEEVLYDMLDSDKRFASKIRTNRREHKQIEDLLNRLDKTSTESEEWMKLLEELENEVKSHVEDEEENLFPRVEEHYDKERLERLDDQYRQKHEQELERAKGSSSKPKRRAS